MSKFFDELLEGVKQMDKIHCGERQPARAFSVNTLQVKEIRKATGLTQAKLAAMIDVQLGTLRKWEQGQLRTDRPCQGVDACDLQRPQACYSGVVRLAVFESPTWSS